MFYIQAKCSRQSAVQRVPGESQVYGPGESHLPSVPGGDDADVGRVLDGYDGPGRQQQLLPGTLQVDDVHT